MSNVETSFTIKTPENHYKIMKWLAETRFDDDDHWPVSEYNDEDHTLYIEEVDADFDDVIGFAQALDEAVRPAPEIANLEFVMEGTTRFLNSGEAMDFRIERRNQKVYVQHTNNYNEWVHEDDDGYVEPEYGKEYDADLHEKAGVIYTIEQDQSPFDVEFDGKIFVHTGLNSKEEFLFNNVVSSRGGIVKGSVVQATDYLIFDESMGTDTVKYKKAMELKQKGKNIKLIPSSLFFSVFNRY